MSRASALSGVKLAGPLQQGGTWVAGALSVFLLLARCEVEDVSALQHAGLSQLKRTWLRALTAAARQPASTRKRAPCMPHAWELGPSTQAACVLDQFTDTSCNAVIEEMRSLNAFQLG